MKQNTGKHARFMLEKRQRVPATAADDEDEEVSTIPVATTSVRGGRQPLPTADPDDEETTTSATTTRGRVPLTTSDSSASLSLGRGGGRTTAEETTTTPAATSLVFTPSSTSSSTSSTTPRTTSRTSTSSTSTRPTTSSTSLSSTTTSSAPASVTSGITNTADTANQTNKDEGGSNTGAIAGAVIGVLVLLAVAAFFGLRYRKKKQRQAEDAAIFNHGGNNPGGAAGLGASAFGKRQSAGYNQHVDSNEDLPSGGNNGNGYGYGEKEFANVGEKQHSSGMAGYGTLALNSAANGNNNNFNGFSSPSHAALLGRDTTGNFSPVQPGAFVAPAFPPGHHDSQDRFSNFSNGYPHSVTAGDGVAEYPPTVAGMQQNPHASMQSFASNSNRRSMGPSAAMMAHPQDKFNSGSSQLPPHQDHALASALNRNSGSAYPAGAVVAAAAAQNVPLPLSPATATRQSMNSVATAAAAAALGNQPTDDSVDGPFGDPSHEGKIYIVTRVFEPSMPDELVFYPGDRIQVVVTYDDGWCLGCNLDSPQRDGKPPARGVFPRDCVEELTPETEAAFASRPASQATVMGNQTPVNFDEDRPIASGGANLQRAPTLPPLDMGNSSRFSMGSAAAARQNEEQARQSKRFSTAPNAGKRQSRAVAESDADDEMDDAYGGVTAVTSATPTRMAFPPEIQVSSSTSPQTGMDARRASHQFGSTQHIADYASQLEQQQQAARRLSTLDEESNSHMTDEFPSTPRTAHPDSPQVSHLAGGNRGSIAASPAGSAARLSIAGLPKSSSATSIKRTSSLIASKDADLFLAFGDLGKDGRQQ